MYQMKSFRLNEVMSAGAELRKLGDGETCLEGVAQRVARYFHDQFADDATGRSAFVLSRCFKTHAFAALPAELQAYARKILGEVEPVPAMRCLTLLGTAGDRPAWQSRHTSVGHQAIPLASEKVVQSLPMIAALTASLGLEANAVVSPDPQMLLEHVRVGFNVFHVAQAAASPHIPAQDWVAEHGVESVIGFGFVLPPADIFAVILFSRVRIEAETAELFKTLALSVKLALLPLASRPAFGA
jgi:hypothetical protein